MKIFFDSWGFRRKHGGIYEYGTQLLRALSNAGHEVHVQAPPDYLPEDLRFRCAYSPYRTFPGWRRMGFTAAHLEWELRKHRPDVFHALAYSRPATHKVPVVATCLDFIHETYPAYAHTKQGRLFRSLKRRSLRFANHVVCISESTRKEGIRLGILEPERSSVVYLAADQAFFHRDEAAIQESRKNYGLDRPYWLYGGPRHGYKNFARLWSAYRDGGFENDFDLVCTGSSKELLQSDRAEWAAKLDGVPPSVHLLGYVSPQDRIHLIQGAAGVVYPTECEGFGLPALEGLAAGVPVLCANTSSLPEVVGDVGILVNPTSEDSIMHGLTMLAEGHPDVSAAQRQAHAATFSWGRCARETLAVYDKVIAE